MIAELVAGVCLAVWLWIMLGGYSQREAEDTGCAVGDPSWVDPVEVCYICTRVTGSDARFCRDCAEVHAEIMGNVNSDD